MAITQTKLAGGGMVPSLDPMPLAHVALIHQPAVSAVVLVDSGMVHVLHQAHREHADGFARGYARGTNLPLLHEVGGLPAGNSAFVYAEWLDSQP